TRWHDEWAEVKPAPHVLVLTPQKETLSNFHSISCSHLETGRRPGILTTAGACLILILKI
ncbi:MAG TPA: hypothetical protein VE398_18435, partial [Acidobacteriota bacterium]|nr:hypothetical protein [Acidobacteriota bacterium]